MLKRIQQGINVVYPELGLNLHHLALEDGVLLVYFCSFFALLCFALYQAREIKYYFGLLWFTLVCQGCLSPSSTYRTLFNGIACSIIWWLRRPISKHGMQMVTIVTAQATNTVNKAHHRAAGVV